MHAIAINDFEHGPALQHVPDPEPAPHEVVVAVEYSSINGFDLAVAAGYLKDTLEHRFPVVLGKDYAGTVVAVGNEVGDFAVGDEVFGVVVKPTLGDGAFGPFVTVPAGVGIAHRPSGLDPVIAGAIGLAGTAASMAVDAVDVDRGDAVLVAGAPGGVGSVAVQLLSSRGAFVIATAATSAERRLVESLGAAATVDHTGDLRRQLALAAPGGPAALIHLAGDGHALVDLLADGGRAASTLYLPPSERRPDVRVTAVHADPTAERLTDLARRIVDGSLRLPISASYPLAQVPAALDAFAAGSTGKVSVSVA